MELVVCQTQVPHDVPCNVTGLQYMDDALCHYINVYCHSHIEVEIMSGDATKPLP